MEKEILRVRLTYNVKQLKKYVDEAILKGAEKIHFDMDKDNPYFIFKSDFTPEENICYELEKLKKDYNEKLKELENKKYKTHYFRIKQYELCSQEIINLSLKFKNQNKIIKSLPYIQKQVITDKYDDFNECMETIFITEVF